MADRPGTHPAPTAEAADAPAVAVECVTTAARAATAGAGNTRLAGAARAPGDGLSVRAVLCTALLGPGTPETLPTRAWAERAAAGRAVRVDVFVASVAEDRAGPAVRLLSETEPVSAWATADPAASNPPTPTDSAPTPSHAYGFNRPRERRRPDLPMAPAPACPVLSPLTPTTPMISAP